MRRKSINEQEELKNKIKYCAKKNQIEKALLLNKEYLNLYPNDDYMTVFYAMLLSKNEEYDKAKKILKSILSKSQVNNNVKFFAMSNYAKISSILGDKNQSIYYLSQIVNNSRYLELLSRHNLAQLYKEKKIYKKAFKVLTIDGFNNQFLNNARASVYISMKKYKSAIIELEKEEIFTPKNISKEILDDKHTEQEKNLLEGFCYFALGEYNESEEYFKRAMKDKNTKIYWTAYLYIAKINILTMDLTKALNILDEIEKSYYSKKISSQIKNLKIKAYTKKLNMKEAIDIINTFDNKVDKILNLARIEIINFNFEKAEELLSKIIYEKTYDNYMEILYLMLVVKFRLKKFNEFQDIFTNTLMDDKINKDYINDYMFDIDKMKLYIDVYQKREFKKKTHYNYLDNQIMKYSSKSALKHIYKRHVFSAHITEFSENIDIDKLFYDIEGKFKDAIKVCDDYVDKYIIDYPNIGHDLDGKTLHQLSVVCLPNTKCILTMYPNSGDRIILDNKNENSMKKVLKPKSQIEKFYEKYPNLKN